MYIALFFTLLIISCGDNGEVSTSGKAKADFYYDDNEHIIVKANLDSLNINLLFDTGGNGIVEIDKSVYDKLFHGVTNHRCEQKGLDKVFDTDIIKEMNGGIVIKVYDTIAISLSGREFVFPEFYVSNTITEYGADGLISIPKNDNHVWELNFQEQYISVLDSCKEVKMNNPIVRELSYDGSFYYVNGIQLSLSSEKDTFLLDGDYIIDTGSYREILSMGMAEGFGDKSLYSFLNTNSIVHFDAKTGRYVSSCYFIKENNFAKDTVEIDVVKESDLITQIIGLRFLSRFNTFLDLKDMTIYMDPITPNPPFNVEPMRSSFKFLRTTRGHYIVCELLKESIFYNGGLRLGDDVISVNDIPIQTLSFEKRKELLSRDQSVFKVFREGKVINITINK